MSRVIRYLVIALLFVPLSGCQALWVIGLQIERAVSKVDILPNTETHLDDCIVNQPCDRTITLHLKAWPQVPWPAVDTGELPPGLTLSAQAIPNQPDSYTISTHGSPTATGDYSFQIGFQCCMTMSGPSEQARTEMITLSVKD